MILFNNFKATSTQTSTSLRILYSGEKIKKRITSDKKMKNSIFKILNKDGYLIYYLNDFVLYPCKTNYVYCYNVFGNKGEVKQYHKLEILIKWINTFLNIYIDPTIKVHFHLIEKNNKKERLMEKFDNNFEHHSKRQIKFFFNKLKESINFKTAIIMHNFSTDGITVTNEQKIDKQKKILEFDLFFGQLIDFLKENKIYNNTLIFITSDTGSDETLLNVKDKKNKFEYSDDGDTIFALLKLPNKIKNLKNVDKTFSQESLSTFLSTYIDENDINFQKIKEYKKNYLLNFGAKGKIEYKLNKKSWIRKN